MVVTGDLAVFVLGAGFLLLMYALLCVLPEYLRARRKGIRFVPVFLGR